MRRGLPWLVAGLGAVLLVAGVVVFAAADAGSGDFGWSAYVPLSQAQDQGALTFADGVVVLWTGEHVLGAGLLVLGLLVLTGVGGWLLGRRIGRRGAPGS